MNTSTIEETMTPEEIEATLTHLTAAIHELDEQLERLTFKVKASLYDSEHSLTM